MPQSQPLVRSMLVTGITALGIGTAWCTFAGWLLMLIVSSLQRQEDYEQLLVTMTGEPVIVRTSRQAGVAEETRDLAGNPVKATSQELLYPQTLSHFDPSDSVSPSDWNYRLTSANDGGTPAVFWYLMHDGQRHGKAHGVGFNQKTKTIVGYFGRNGFRDTPPPPEDCFVIDGNQALQGATGRTNLYQPGFWRASDSLLPLLADQKLWVIDVAKRQVKVLIDCPAGQQLGSAWRLFKELPPLNPDEMFHQAQVITPSDVMVRQPDSLIVVNHRTGDHQTYPLPPDCRHAAVSAFLLGDQSLLLTAIDPHGWREGQDVVWIAPTGEVLKRQHVRLMGHSGGELEPAMGWFCAAVAPAPVSSATIVALVPATMVHSGQADSYTAGLVELVSKIWTSLLAVAAVSCLTAVLAYRRQKRFGLPHPAAWAAFAFLGGLPGWFAYRFHRTWLVLEDCPSCHQPSPRDRVNCLDCGKPFPPSPLKGIEVFA